MVLCAFAAFSLVMISPDRIFAARDPRGFRPLAMGRIPALPGEKQDTVVFASETCAFDLIGATYVREVKPGDTISLRQGYCIRTVVVKGISSARAAAPIAQALFEETAQSMAAREKAAELRQYAAEPAHTQEHGRPTKRDRRDLAQTQNWDSRWSASIDS